MSPDERIEQVMHKHVWALANQYSSVERAVREARSFVYLALSDPDPNVLRAVGENWLEHFGRDRLRETAPGGES